MSKGMWSFSLLGAHEHGVTLKEPVGILAERSFALRFAFYAASMTNMTLKVVQISGTLFDLIRKRLLYAPTN
jgi:hypothetical protein